MRYLYSLILLYFLFSCGNPPKEEEQILGLNHLFKPIEQKSILWYDFTRKPKDLEQYLIEQVPLSKCDDFGSCKLTMGFLKLDEDTVFCPVKLDGLFKTDDSPIFCGIRNYVFIVINRNNRLLFDETPIELKELKEKLNKKISEYSSEGDKVGLGILVRWHTFTKSEVLQDVFTQVLDVINIYYETECIRLFHKPISELNTEEKVFFLEEVNPVYITNEYNKKVRKLPYSKSPKIEL